MYRFQLIIAHVCWRGCFHSNGPRILTGKQCYCCWYSEPDLVPAYSNAWSIFPSSNRDSVVPPNSRPLQYVLAVVSRSEWTNPSVFMGLYLAVFKGASAKSRKASVTSTLFWDVTQLRVVPPDGADFHEIHILVVVENSIEKIRFSLKSDNNNGHFTWSPIYIFDHISLVSS
jgi:hypothetical protein